MHSVKTLPLLGREKAMAYTEWAANLGVGGDIGWGRVTAGIEYVSIGGTSPYLKGELLGGELEFQPGQVTVGYVPGGGPGGRIGINWEMGGGQMFLTYRGYLDQMGGIEKFGQKYAPDAVLKWVHFERGYWSRGRWVSGLDALRWHVRLRWRFDESICREVP